MTLIDTVLQQSDHVIQQHDWGHAVWHVWGGERHGSERPLVLFHGGSGSWTHWVRNVVHWARQRPVWALDLPGFGDSSLPPEVRDADSLAPYVGDVLATAFGAQAVDVMGFSFGGLTAGLLAGIRPELMARLFLVGVPGLGLMRESLPMRGMLPEMTYAQQRAVHRHNLRVMMLHDDASITEELIDLQEANVARDRMRRRRIARTDVLARAQDAWQCTVHGIWGEKDALYQSNLHRIPEVLHRLNSFHCIAGAGHWVAYESADAFHGVVDRLLNDASTRG
jgi:2-hydroxy-6-oxonona-2,4-dienedioate hydrolase